MDVKDSSRSDHRPKLKQIASLKLRTTPSQSTAKRYFVGTWLTIHVLTPGVRAVGAIELVAVIEAVEVDEFDVAAGPGGSFEFGREA